MNMCAFLFFYSKYNARVETVAPSLQVVFAVLVYRRIIAYTLANKYINVCVCVCCLLYTSRCV